MNSVWYYKRIQRAKSARVTEGYTYTFCASVCYEYACISQPQILEA